jgi:uncharacterized membrane protein YqjE
MNTQHAPEATHPGILPLLMSMAGTRLELAVLDMEAHAQATFAALMMAFAALVLALVAFAFVGVAVIVYFWESHRVAAAAGVMLAYAALAIALAFRAWSRWRTRPAALAATMHELELDAQAFKGRL